MASPAGGTIVERITDLIGSDAFNDAVLTNEVDLINAAINEISDMVGEEVLLRAIKAPYFTILENAGITASEPQDKGVGLNAITGEPVDMVKHGIIDPLMVTKSALRNAASVATTILSTDCVINNLRANEGDR